MLEKNIKIVQVLVTDLNPALYNPRRWEESAKVELRESITKYGLIDPLIVNGHSDRKNIVIGGHFRLYIAKEFGFKKVPVIYVQIEDIDREKDLNLRLNHALGDWDFEILKDFDPSLLMDVGFTDSELSAIWDAQLETEDDGFDVDKVLHEIGEPVTKLGDVIKLGKHFLICGDSQDPKVLEHLMHGKKANTIYTDPIYNINLSYNKGISTSGKYGGNQTKDNLSDEAYKELLRKVLINGLAHTNSDAHIFTYCDQNNVWILQTLYPELGISPKRLLTWIKNQINMTPGLAFNKATESCVYGTIGKPYLNEQNHNLSEVLNKEVGSGNRSIDDILDLIDIWLVRRIPATEYEHPTQKPVTLHEKPLRRCTRAGDIVLDPFAGSGSLLIACEQMNRIAFLVELEPIFCDLIIRRYIELTGGKVVRCRG